MLSLIRPQPWGTNEMNPERDMDCSMATWDGRRKPLALAILCQDPATSSKDSYSYDSSPEILVGFSVYERGHLTGGLCQADVSLCLWVFRVLCGFSGIKSHGPLTPVKGGTLPSD